METFPERPQARVLKGSAIFVAILPKHLGSQVCFPVSGTLETFATSHDKCTMRHTEYVRETGKLNRANKVQILQVLALYSTENVMNASEPGEYN